jgi:Argonaute linker 1 domain
MIFTARLMAVGRNFFSPPQGRVITLGNGMDLWHGVFQSAFLGYRNLFFNVDGRLIKLVQYVKKFQHNCLV